MVQFVQLQSNLQAFQDAGINVVAITYDSPELQQQFIDKNSISYPFLSDIDAHTVNALGILNEDHQPGDDNYGIPHPGIFVVNSDKKIVGKIVLDSYQKRVDAQAVLAYAIQQLN
ncbi:MAG: peroxiredoxin [Halioglobus sp.]|jgi:peroxiredoxin